MPSAGIGPPVDERFATVEAVGHLEDHGFDVERAEERSETWLVVAQAPAA